jgi:CDP-6-deoxy-D-xylo-4-hexulose-3-dehydrase
VGFPTTIAPIIQNGLKPVFVDIELDTLNFDVNLIEAKITPKTRAIFVSPVLGNPPDMDRLVEICNKHNIVLLGDNCDSLGTQWKGKLITDLYYAWTTSFYPAHHISTGEGGMVCSNDENFIKEARSISWWGRDCYCVGANNLLECGTCGKRFDNWIPEYDGIMDHKYLFTNIGYNLKPLDLQGAIGSVQLKKFDMLESKRREYKNKIQKMITDNIKEVRVIDALDGSDPSWFGVPIFCESQDVKEFLVSHFEANKIQTRNYFSGNILMHPGYSHLESYKNYPNSNLALSNVFFLGCSPLYNEKVLNYINSVCEKWNK